MKNQVLINSITSPLKKIKFNHIKIIAFKHVHNQQRSN